MLTQRPSFKHLLAPLSLSLLLSACTGLNFNQSALLTNKDLASSDYYLRQSQRLDAGEEKMAYQLLAARALLTENKLNQAKGLLDSLHNLSDKQLQDKTLIEIDYFLQASQSTKSSSLLNTLIFDDLSYSQKYYYLTLSSKINQSHKEYLVAVSDLIKAEDYLSTLPQKQQNNDEIWNVLLATHPDTIQNTLIYAEQDPKLKSWLTLSDLYHQHHQDINALHQALLNWKAQNGQFSASYLLPTPLQNVLNFQRTEVSNIALLLPLSGNGKLIGETVKKGFESGYGNSYVPVQVFDTASQPLDSIIQQVKAQNITTVVGPLLKNKVEELIQRPDLHGLNILTLNQTTNEQPLSNVCYFGLSPEDEAVANAEKMWQEGIKNPLVLMPKNTLGQRLGIAFASRWQALSGTDPKVAYYKEMTDLRPILTNALGIIESAQTQNSKTVYQSRNRQQFDSSFQPVEAVFALGNPQQLADIKTAIDNTETHIPVYADSHLNSPNNPPAYRLLMDGTKFTDLPIFTEINSDSFKQMASQNKGDYSLMRLYAMGLDAWKLINHFSEMKSIPNFNIQGATGKLSANYACQIQRELTWFEYKEGQLKLVNDNFFNPAL